MCASPLYLGAPLALCALISSAPLARAEEVAEQERIAVLQMVNRAGFKADEVSYLTNSIRQTLSTKSGPRFLVMTQENILKLLPPDVKLEDCVGECEVETGRTLGARYIVTGELIQFGEALRLNIRLHETTGGALLVAETAKGFNINEIETALERAAQVLYDKLTARLQAERDERARAENERARAEKAQREAREAERRQVAQRAVRDSAAPATVRTPTPPPKSRSIQRSFFFNLSAGASQCAGTRVQCGAYFDVPGATYDDMPISEAPYMNFKMDSDGQRGLGLLGGIGTFFWWGNNSNPQNLDKISIGVDFSFYYFSATEADISQYYNSFSMKIENRTSAFNVKSISLIPFLGYMISINDDASLNIIALDFFETRLGLGRSWTNFSDGMQDSESSNDLNYAASVFKLSAYTGWQFGNTHFGPFVDYLTSASYQLTNYCSQFTDNNCDLDAPKVKEVERPGMWHYGARLLISL